VSSELERIARLLARLAHDAPGVVVGIGDDAAVLDPPPSGAGGEKLVWTIDEQVEGTHFERELMTFADVGWRSVMAAASDLAAMAARPLGILASVVLPADLDEDAFDALVAGQRAASDALGAPIVGGNLARGPCVSVATTVLGAAASPVLRAGARPGDVVLATGPLGLAAAGLAGLQRGVAVPDAALEAWRRPVARIDAGRAMIGKATAAIDVSDGLARDAGHLAAASGVRVVLDADRLRAAAAPALVVAARALDAEPLDLMVAGGEDYALVCTSPGAIEGFVRIGEIEPGSGVFVRDGTREWPAHGGFDHFA